MPERLDLPASRNETWRPVIEYVYEGAALPLTDAVIRLQWRLYPGAPGDPLIECVSGTDSLAFEDVEPTADEIAEGVARDGDRILRIEPVVEVADLTALPSGLNEPEAGEADKYSWDVVIEYADGVIDRPLAGEIFCDPGVTIDV